MLNAMMITQLIASYPLWALVIIGLDVIVIYNPAAREGEQQPQGYGAPLRSRGAPFACLLAQLQTRSLSAAAK